MTNLEAIEELKYDCNELGKAIPCDTGHGQSINTSYGMAVAALEKQIPKEPIGYEDKYYGCPNCGNPVMHKWKKYPTVLNDKKNGLPYCLGCGQALDWGENSKD